MARSMNSFGILPQGCIVSAVLGREPRPLLVKSAQSPFADPGTLPASPFPDALTLVVSPLRCTVQGSSEL